MIRENNILQYVIAILASAVILAVSCVVPYPLNNHVVWLPIVFLGIVAGAEGFCGLLAVLQNRFRGLI